MAIIFPNSQIGEVAGESWRITAQFTGDNNPIGGNGLTNWEKSDDVYGGGNISSNILSESSGIFTFGANYYGWYLVIFHHYMYYSDNNRYGEMELQVSWNGGSNYDNHGYATSHVSPNTSANYNQCATGCSVVNATSNTRLRFRITQWNNSAITYGESNAQATGFSLIRISDNP
jgi:hypothetical protein